MPRTRRFSNTFLGGEVSPEVYERYDFEKRDSSLARLENMIPRVQGPIRRRDGSRFVNLAKNADETIRLIPFVFSRTQAYIIELGNFYARFYRDEGVLVDPPVVGPPVEIATPWTAAQLRDIDFAQDADTMIFVHPDVEPQILRRTDDLTWGLSDLSLRPGPTLSSDYLKAASNLVLGSVSGTGVTLTETLFDPAGTFRIGDVGRTLVETGVGATGIATIATFVDINNVTVDIFVPFSQVNLFDSGGQPSWLIQGSPLTEVAIIDQDTGEPDITGAIGDRVTLIGYKRRIETFPDLIVNGDFTTGPAPFLIPWGFIDQTLTTGTATGGAADTLIDTTKNFVETFGVNVNHIVENLTSPREGSQYIISFASSAGGPGFDTINLATGGPSFMAGDSYTIRRSGTAIATGAGGVELEAGLNGVGHIEQSVLADQRSVYEYVIKTSEGNLQLQFGTSVDQGDVVEPVTITPGETRAIITTPNIDGLATFTLYVQVFNNQNNTLGKLESISLRKVEVNPWAQPPTPVGTYIRINGGYVQTTSAPQAEGEVNAVVVQRLEALDDAIAGAWTIEEEVFGKVGGYPTSVTFFQGRLWFAAFNQVFGSVINNFSSFAFGPDPGDGIVFSPNATEVNPIHWMIGETSLVLGSRAEEFKVDGTDTSTIRAGDIDLSSPTAIGTEPIQPKRIRNTLLMVKAGGQRVFEMSLTQAGDERSERDLSILAEHMIVRGDRIVEIAWQDQPERTLWVVTELGGLFSLTYIREHNIFAWARHGSSDGATFSSIASIPHPDGDRDQIWIAVKRSSNTRDIVEVFDDDDGLYDNNPATMVDSAVRYSGVATDTITGLTHLINLSNVWVVDSKGPQGPFTVSATGVITGIQRDVTDADIGIYYEPIMSTLRPSVDGTGPTGLLLGKVEMFVRLYNTGDGVVANERLLKLRKPTDLMDSRIVPITGEIKIPSNGTDRDSIITLSQSIPETFEVQSIAGSIEVEDI